MDMWVVARTKPHQEAWAGENILRQGYHFYLPKIKEWTTQKGRKVVEALFPSYIFVLTNGPWHWLTGTFGIACVVTVGQNPATLSQRYVDVLRAREDHEGLVKLPESRRRSLRFQLGQGIRVIEGPFSGLFGLYTGSSGPERASVLLDLLGRKTPVRIDEALLEAA